MNGIEKEFIVDTGSPISIMPADENILKKTEMQKIKHRYQDVNKNEVKFRGQIPTDIEYENNKQNTNSLNTTLPTFKDVLCFIIDQLLTTGIMFYDHCIAQVNPYIRKHGIVWLLHEYCMFIAWTSTGWCW